VRQADRWVGAGTTALAVAVLWSASSFPNVPGQKLGASTLPLIIGAALLVCGLLLVLRSLSAARYVKPIAPVVHNPLLPELAAPDGPTESIAPSMGILAAIVLYIVAADALGYLLVAPVSLLIAQVSLRVRWLPAIGWSLLAAVVVHLVFYKLLKVPLPWGIVPVLY
jgi:putative tricarboxylic transport membrane protein